MSDGDLATLRGKVNSERRIKLELQYETEFRTRKVRLISADGTTLHLGFRPEEITTAELIRQLAESYPVKDILVENPPIEELIAQLYAGSVVEVGSR